MCLRVTFTIPALVTPVADRVMKVVAQEIPEMAAVVILKNPSFCPGRSLTASWLLQSKLATVQ